MASLEVDTRKQMAPLLPARAAQLTGWLTETSAVELNSKFHGSWTPSRRFGLHQKQKTCVTDDFSASQTNSGVHVPKTFHPEGVEDTVCALRLWYRSGYRQLGVARSGEFCSLISVWCLVVQKPVVV
eukprot:3815027-Amphidinium_carterae.1